MNDVALTNSPATAISAPSEAGPPRVQVLPSEGVLFLLQHSVSNTPFNIPTKDTSGGVYCILNQVTGKHYIGKASNLRIRQQTHISELRCGRHHSQKLSRSVNKHGFSAFTFYVLMHESDELRRSSIEAHIIKTTKAFRCGYNCAESDSAGHSFGYGDSVADALYKKNCGISLTSAVLIATEMAIGRATAGEIARSIGCSTNAVHSLLKRSNTRLISKSEQLSKLKLGKPGDRSKKSASHCMSVHEARRFNHPKYGYFGMCNMVAGYVESGSFSLQEACNELGITFKIIRGIIRKHNLFMLYPKQTCRNCLAAFYPDARDPNWTRRVFCSNSCRELFGNKKPRRHRTSGA